MIRIACMLLCVGVVNVQLSLLHGLLHSSRVILWDFSCHFVYIATECWVFGLNLMAVKFVVSGV